MLLYNILQPQILYELYYLIAQDRDALKNDVCLHVLPIIPFLYDFHNPISSELIHFISFLDL